MKIKAKWIWKKQKDRNPYNQTIYARKSFRISTIGSATIAVTADSYYRLYINGVWINDGPARSWPDNFSYDVFELTNYLKAGLNEIVIQAKYFGTGTAHNIPQEPGLLAQLEIKSPSGESTYICTDKTWLIAEVKSFISATAKISFSAKPSELYDAKNEKLNYKSAAEIYRAFGGPWKNLRQRDIPHLTKRLVRVEKHIASNIVRADGLDFCVPVTRLIYPDLIEADRNMSTPFAMFTILRTVRRCQIVVLSESLIGAKFKIAVNGKHNTDGVYDLHPGRNILSAITDNIRMHAKDISLRFVSIPAAVKFENPLGRVGKNPWCIMKFPEYSYADNDLYWKSPAEKYPRAVKTLAAFDPVVEELIGKSANLNSFVRFLRLNAEYIETEQMFVIDSYWQFANRAVVSKASGFVRNPKFLTDNNSKYTSIIPSNKGDIELIYDMGRQACGYYSFELYTDAGVIIDIAGVENLDKDCNPQHTVRNRNTIRYITKKGHNKFISIVRRSGRYIFLTIRNNKTPVKFQKFELIESVYPIEHKTTFHCSNHELNRIWQISRQTLELCMEDVFTDCPLYEQTLWVGDARNESLYAYYTFGIKDLAKRCIELASQSLDKFPIVSPVAPTSAKFIIPAWSFLWNISVWDYYWYTADLKFLKKIWPCAVKNLKSAQTFLDERGLFSAPFWHFFDWIGMDNDHKIVLYNSMLMVGAINAALKCANVLKDEIAIVWLSGLRSSLCRAINSTFDKNKYRYPNSIHSDGSKSSMSCIHDCLLAVLYEIAPKALVPRLCSYIGNPPADMIGMGSPFVFQYLYETMEKLGMEDKIIKSIIRNYRPMLKAGATTVWECFSAEKLDKCSFPTRSHCHAWSASALYFLHRTILGIKQTKPGCNEFVISPYISGIKSACGSILTPKGLLEVSWSRDKENLNLDITFPSEIKIKVLRNDTFGQLRLQLSKKQI
ncbi:MAG: hypothetical protein A2Y10_17395 [Planctomycetes bacterium GWF2_41_51]|nr:MAG: hypothetical protein A2Y10_17395 [Planctomycetes bacterium GWF2_41_51]HBG28002.1 hypothetical protein [Phycisphaerales bacterium]